MAKELEENNPTQHHERRLQQQPGSKSDEQKPEGSAFEINDNTVGGKEPAQSPTIKHQGSADKPDHETPHGKAIRINKNSV